MEATNSSSSSLSSYKAAFLSEYIDAGVLKFGTFKLKSGRVSPYFFNAGVFHTAELSRLLIPAYAATLDASGVEFDVLFGPAYKGIPLAALTVYELSALDQKYKKISYSFNRKEAKDHGEGGNVVGASLSGKRVVIIDDVITAGTAIREAIEIIQKAGGTLVGIIVAFDRLEKAPSEKDDDGKPGPSAIGELRRAFGIPVLSILTLDDILDYLKKIGTEDDIKRLQEYRERYMASD